MKYDCLFVGNAIVDILADVSFEFMNDQGIEPGSWRPIDEEEILKLQSKIINKKIASGGKVLIVSTKKQASEQVSALAKETNQYFVNYRWLGGMLTNWNTISNSIKRLKNPKL